MTNSTNSDAQDLTLGVYAVLPIDQLHPAADNPRKNLGDLVDMAASIKAIGIVEPLVVRPLEDAGYMIVCGHRRHAAAIKAGIDRVPCVVRALEDLERHKLMLQENMQRSSLTPLEEAEAFAKIAALGVRQKDLAREVGCSQPTVSKRLALLALPDNAKEALDSGRISIEQASALARLKDDPVRTRRVLDAQPANRDWTLKNQLDEYKHDRARAKAIADLEAAGVPLLEYMRGVDTLGVDYGVMVDVEAHAAEPCHAANVSWQGDVKYLCTDRDRHRPNGDSPLKATNLADDGEDEDPGRVAGETHEEARAAEHAQLEQRRAASAERRRSYIASLFDTTELYGVTSLLAAHAADASEVEWDAVPLALTFLGHQVDPDDRDREWWDDWEKLTETVAEGDDLVRVGAAIALADAECRLHSRWGGYGGRWTGPRIRRHIDWLTTNGYELDDYEQARVDEAEESARAANQPDDDLKAEASADEVRACRECGCTDQIACDGGCWWVEDDLCSACAHPDQQEPDEEESAGPDAAVTGSGADAQTVSAGDDQDLRPDIEVAVAQAGKKWKVTCSACGEVGRNTSQAFADERAEAHRAGHLPQPDAELVDA